MRSDAVLAFRIEIYADEDLKQILQIFLLANMEKVGLRCCRRWTKTKARFRPGVPVPSHRGSIGHYGYYASDFPSEVRLTVSSISAHRTLTRVCGSDGTPPHTLASRVSDTSARRSAPIISTNTTTRSRLLRALTTPS